MLLEPRRRLHFGHAEAAVATLEDVGAHEDATVTEGGLEDDEVTGSAKGELGLAYRPAEVVLPPDEDAVRVQTAGDVVDIVARGEPPLRLGRVYGKRRAVDLQPQAPTALQAVGDA